MAWNRGLALLLVLWSLINSQPPNQTLIRWFFLYNQTVSDYQTGWKLHWAGCMWLKPYILYPCHGISAVPLSDPTAVMMMSLMEMGDDQMIRLLMHKSTVSISPISESRSKNRPFYFTPRLPHTSSSQDKKENNKKKKVKSYLFQ